LKKKKDNKGLLGPFKGSEVLGSEVQGSEAKKINQL
jgi:hypothetical protein